jgi:hypothetical protein
LVRTLRVLAVTSTLALTLVGCRESLLTAPEATSSRPDVTPAEIYPIGQVGGPQETEVTAQFWRDSLEIRIRRERSVLGTQFQAMVNADLQSTGYGDGYDYVLRGPEVSTDGSFPIRLADPLNDDNPGGWGEIVGTGQSSEHGQRLLIHVAQSTLGGTSACRLEVALLRDGALVFEWLGGAGSPQTGIARLTLGPRAPGSRLPRSR